jgi:hypothetical protein
MNSLKKITRNSSIVFNIIDDETVLFNPSTGKYYGLDDISSEVWHILHRESTVRELVNKLMLKYEVDYAKCEKDILILLNDWKSKEIVFETN